MPLTPTEAEKLIDAIRGLQGEAPRLKPRADVLNGRTPSMERGQVLPGNGQPQSIAPALKDPDTLEWLFREFRNRMIDSLSQDPIFVRLLANQPELVVEITPRVVEVDGSSLRGRVARLIAAGFFENGKRQGEARAELARTGSDPNSGQLSTLFSEFVRDGFLEKTAGDRYVKAPGLKVSQKRIEA